MGWNPFDFVQNQKIKSLNKLFNSSDILKSIEKFKNQSARMNKEKKDIIVEKGRVSQLC